MDDKQAQALYARFIALQEQAENLNQHLEQMREQIKHIEETKKTITELQSVKEPRESWIPIAPGAFVKATIQPLGNVLLNIGSAVAVEKRPEEVIATLEGHIKVLHELSDAGYAELKGVLKEVEDIKSTVEKDPPENDVTKSHVHDHHDHSGHDHSHGGH